MTAAEKFKAEHIDNFIKDIPDAQNIADVAIVSEVILTDLNTLSPLE